MSLGELRNGSVLILTHKKGKVNVNGSLPSVCVVEKSILGSRCEIFRTTYYVSNAHKMVVDNVAEVVCGISVSLHKDLVLKLGVVHRDLAENRVNVACSTLKRHLLSDNEGHTCSEVSLNLFLRELAAMSVISACSILLVKLFKALLCAEAVVSVAHLNELLCILHIYFLTLGLNVGTVIASNVGTFIPVEACHLECGLNNVGCTLNESFSIGIFNSENKVTVIVLCYKVGVKRGS